MSFLRTEPINFSSIPGILGLLILNLTRVSVYLTLLLQP